MRSRCFYFFVGWGMMLFGLSCSSSKDAFTPMHKYSADQLRTDYTVLRDILENFHPSLYWYTPKDSMDYYFDTYYSAINDSMTQQQFGFRILAPLTTKIRCGHTSFNYSKSYNKYMRGRQLPSFPLFMKIWGDTAVVTTNLNRDDSIIKRGTLLTSINGLSNTRLIDSLFKFMPTDGYSENVNFIRLSSAFPYYHRNIFGLYKNYLVNYLDSSGAETSVQVPVYDPYADTLNKLIQNVIPEPRTKK